jgi:molybdopterin synthase sulfur carrier subunit
MSDAVRVILPSALRDLAEGQGELAVTLEGAASSLRTVLDAAVDDRPRLASRIRDETGALRRHVNVFVDGEDIRRLGGLDVVVDPGAVIHILPSVAGG